MTLNETQVAWIRGFVAVSAEQATLERDDTLRSVHLARLHKALRTFRTEFKKAYEIAVEARGKKIGSLLEKGGTQLDEVDSAEFIAHQQKAGGEASKAADDLANRANNFIANWTEELKKVKTPEGERLFSDTDIKEELYTPLVRERMVPETIVGNFYSETQSMIDRTNELYESAVAQKVAAGEELTPKLDRGKAIMAMTGGLASAAAGFLGDAGLEDLAGVDKDKVALAKNILDGVKMTADVGDSLNELIRNSDFPGAADSLIDNIGALLGHVVGMATGDKELGKQIGNGYSAAGSVAKAGMYLRDGNYDAALGALASGLESAVKAGDPKGDNKDLSKGAKLAAMALRNGGTTFDIAKNVQSGGAAAVVDGLTKIAKNSLSTSFDVAGKSGSKEAQLAEDITDWSGVALKTGVKVYDAAKQGDIAGGVSEIVSAVSGQLTSILQRANVDKKKASMIGDGFSGATNVSQVVACLIKSPPDVQGAMTAMGAGIEKAFVRAGGDSMKEAGSEVAKAFATAGSGIELAKLYSETPIQHDKVVAQFEDVMKKLGKTALRQTEEGDEEDDSLEHFDLTEAFGDSAKQLNELDAASIELRQKQAEQDDALAAARGSGNSREMVELLEQSTHGELTQSEAAKIDTLIAQMVKDRMIIDMALKIAQGGAAVAAKFVPAMGAAGNAIKLAANIMAAAERGRDLYHWKKNTKDFEKAQNMLAAASANFVRNQAEQFSYYTIQAAFEAAQLVGELAGATGIATAAGKAVVAAAEAAKSCQDLVRDYARKEDLETAWRKTCKAFNNPTNRKLALQARSMNPTLAKYSIAWGAYEKKDPLARNAVRAINLTESSLEHEDTDCDKVVQYMETYFRDDLTLYREVELDGDWLPADISLSMKSWSTIKARAVKSAKLEGTDTPRIDAQLADVQGIVNSVRATDVDDAVGKITDPDMAEALVDALSRLAGDFRGYKPKCSEAGVKVFAGVTRNLSDQCKNMNKALRDRVEVLGQQRAVLGELMGAAN